MVTFSEYDIENNPELVELIQMVDNVAGYGDWIVLQLENASEEEGALDLLSSLEKLNMAIPSHLQQGFGAFIENLDRSYIGNKARELYAELTAPTA